MVAKGEGEGELTGILIGRHDSFSREDRHLSWLQGVRYTFRTRLFLLPLPGTSRAGNGTSFSLTSESWLGREPSYAECLKEMGTKGGLIDNGC
jgi:hypothetical protein